MEKFIKSIVENSVKPNEIGKLEEFGISELKNGKTIEQDLDLVKSGSLESLNSLNQEKNLDLNKLSFPTISESDKTRIREESGFSDKIIESLRNTGEYDIYKQANLSESKVNERACLIRNDIDLEQKDSMGRTNRERTELGLAPLDKDGIPLELHHIGQKMDSPLAELTRNEHREKPGNFEVLHDNRRESEIDRKQFDEERRHHWMNRFNQ